MFCFICSMALIWVQKRATPGFHGNQLVRLPLAESDRKSLFLKAGCQIRFQSEVSEKTSHVSCGSCMRSCPRGCGPELPPWPASPSPSPPPFLSPSNLSNHPLREGEEAARK